jgi:putative FmdB family regulatory protein
MPLYEYACRNCGHQFEARQKMSDDPIKTCPNCQQDTVERLVSRSSFALKGSGWYADGYGGGAGGSDATKSETKKEATPQTKTETKSDAPKAESKPAAPESKPKKDTGD